MLKILLKKQLYEINRNFFYNPKKNEARSKSSSIIFIILYILLMVGIHGGMFSFFAYFVCKPLVDVGVGWLYFIIFSLLGIFLGVLGSVFNTYSSLYKAKDNDLLLSMPIPNRYIIISRLLGVYLMGLMFSAVVVLPCVIVYLCVAPFSIAAVFGGLMLIILISAIVFILSCLLGWVVAKISDKLKNKSIITVFVSLAMIGAYYFFYFKIGDIMQTLVENAEIIAKKTKSGAYALYMFGRIGEGSISAIIVYTLVFAVLFALTYAIISRSFLSLATSTGKTSRVEYKETYAKQKSTDRALLSKEIRRFTASPNYMLNCGMGILFSIILGVIILIKKGAVSEFVSAFEIKDGYIMLFAAAILCMLASMNDTAAPSVSLEGKSLWLLQSLPVKPWQVLKAKINLQLLLTVPPLLFCSVCFAIALKPDIFSLLLLIIYPIIYAFFSACFGLIIGVLKPNLTWTNEITPIKQSLPVFLVLFSGWIYAGIIILCYFLLKKLVTVAVFLTLAAALTAIAAVLMLCWLKKQGSRRFELL